jgi:hypothetical protein
VTPGARNFASVDVYVEPCPQGTLIYQDDFGSRPGGVYAMTLDEPGGRGFSPDPIFADFAAGIDARCTRADVDCRYGIDFRELPGPGETRTNAYYRYIVDPTDGTFTLDYLPAGAGDMRHQELVPWTPSSAIRRGTATNRVAVIAQGGWIRLFANGVQVAEARDEQRPWGQIGWTSYTQMSGRGVEVQFDNFQVTTPGPAETLVPLFPTDGTLGAAGPPPGPSGPPPAPAGPAVLFQDNFSNPNSGWPQQASDPTTRRVGYGSGDYFVVKLPGSGGAPFVTRAERFRDFQMEVDARLVPPTTDAYLYLDFRRQPNDDHYTFVVDPNDSTFLLRRNVGPSGSNLIGWTEHRAIRQAGAPNRIGVRVEGPSIVLLVNGQEVGRAQDGALQEGTIAFGVGSLSDGPAEGRFSNLVVTSVN